MSAQPSGKVSAPATDQASSALSFSQKKQLAAGWLRDQFRAYQEAGGKEPLRTWLQSKVVEALQAQPQLNPGNRPVSLNSPVATGTADKTTPSPYPPPEPGLKSEGLGPLEWLFWAGEIGEKGVEGGIDVLGEFSVGGIIDYIEDAVSAASDPTGGSGSGDGSYGDYPGGSGLDTGGSSGGDGSGGGDPTKDSDPPLHED
jgi:hypothetical protein